MKILVTDFDGTLTARDFYDLVRERWPVPAEDDPWESYVRGEITHFEALRRIFERMPGSREDLLEIVGQMGIPRDLGDAVALLQRDGWSVEIASAGCIWYIDILLRNAGVEIPVHANPGSPAPGGGLRMQLPDNSPFLSPSTGIDKKAVVAAAIDRAEVVAFAGDGRPDLEPALLVPAEFRFARGWLASALEARGEGFSRFKEWPDIVKKLLSK